jgi:hypothetical protein
MRRATTKFPLYNAVRNLTVPALVLSFALLATLAQGQRTAKQQNDGNLDRNCAEFLKWSQQLEHAFPGKDLFHSNLAAMVVPLFDDPAFVPFFGKPFDQMTVEERTAYLRTTISACLNSTHRRDFSWQMNVLRMPFVPNAPPHNPYSATQLIIELKSLREARAGLKRLRAEITSMSPTSGSYIRLTALQASANQFLPLVWPAEQNEFNASIASASSRFASPTLREKVDGLLASAKGYDGLVNLKQSASRYRDLFSAVTPQQKVQQQQRIDAKFPEIITQEMSEQKSLLEKSGPGASGLRDGVKWYEGFQKYRDLGGPEVEAVSEAFHMKRRAQLSTAEGEIEKAVRQARTET